MEMRRWPVLSMHTASLPMLVAYQRLFQYHPLIGDRALFDVAQWRRVCVQPVEKVSTKLISK
jgi:hypothetical protein